VVEHLPHKCKALSSNCSTTKKENKKTQKTTHNYFFNVCSDGELIPGD
jgi:hypothetical protein